MDLARKISIGIVMIIPSFVFSAMFWAWFESWFAVLIMLLIMAGLYYTIITGRAEPVFRQIVGRAVSDFSSLPGRRGNRA